MTDATVRAFVAVELNTAIRDALAKVQRRLRTANARVSWVHPDRMHLTVVFLGDLPVDAVPRVANGLEDIARNTPPFQLQLAGGGAFGPPRRPRVIWAGVNDEAGALQAVHQQVAQRLVEANVGFDERPFTPHLTLGRVRARHGLDQLATLLERIEWPTDVSMTVRQIHLLQSHLGAQGATYETLHAAALAG